MFNTSLLFRTFSLRQMLTSGIFVVGMLAFMKFLIHLITNDNYGYFRDEFYYIAASKRLELGYVDFPAFIALVALFTREFIGESQVALRFFPSIAGALIVFITGLMARDLGGGRFAQIVAALCSLVAANILAFSTVFSMDAFEQLFWVTACYIVLRIIQTGNSRLWLVFGLVAGLGLFTKMTILYFGFSLFIGLLLFNRKELRSPWFWLGGLIAVTFVVPYLIWQIRYGWPTLEFWSNYGGKIISYSPIGFIRQQVVTMNPINVPFWIAGLYYFLFTQNGKPYRVFGWSFLILLFLFAFGNAKFYFLTAAFPIVFAAGGVVFENLTRDRFRPWGRPTTIAALSISGAIMAPMVLPILPVDDLVQLASYLGGDGGVKAEDREIDVLPQHFADRFGWEHMVATVAGVYQGLSPEDQERSCIFTVNYGEAGAMEFFGPSHGLPPTISGHNSYYLWGPRECSGDVMITLGLSQADLSLLYSDVQYATTFTCEYCMPDENNLPIHIVREPKVPIEVAWSQIKFIQ